MSDIERDVRRIRAWERDFQNGGLSRREFVSLAAGVSSAALLASCAGGAAESPSGGNGDGATALPFYTNENDPESLALVRAAIAEFNTEYPDVTVTVNTWDGTVPTTLTSLRSQSDLGVFNVSTPSVIPEWARAGYLLPLTELIDEIGPDDFLDGTRIVVDDEDYAMPYQANSSLLYYRRDILDEHGFAAPTTYEELLEIVSELNGRGDLIGIATAAGEGNLIPKQFLTPYVYQSGWDFFGPDGSVTFGEPEVLDGVKRYIDILRHTEPSLYNGGYGDITSAYVSGRAIFATFPGRLGVNTAEQAPEVAENTGVIGVPAGPFMTGGLHHGTLTSYVVHAETAAPEAATAFVKTLTTGQIALDYALSVPGHLLPALNSVAADLRSAVETSDDDYVSAHRDWVITFLDHVETAMDPALSMGAVHDHAFEGRIWRMAPWADRIWAAETFDRTMAQNILISGNDVEDEWRVAVETLEQAVADFRAENPDWTPEG